MLISHKFRGEDVDVDVTDKREPYEWLFYGKTVAEHDALNITPAEDEAISQLIYNTIYDLAASDGWDC